MTGLLTLSSARFYLHHRAQLLLALAGIGLGVAVFVGVSLAIDSSTRAFEQSAGFVRGRATHRLLPVGGDLDETAYAAIVHAHGVAAAPVVETYVQIAASSTRVRLLGIDPIEEAGFRELARFAPQDAGSIAKLIAEASTVLVSEALRERITGDHMSLTTASGTHDVEIVGTVAGLEDLVIADVSTAQELTGSLGRLSRIDLILSPWQVEEIEAGLPAATALVTASNEDPAFAQLTRAFQTNVSALGLLALVVGAFLIYSTMSFAVVQRRQSLAILRTLGASRREILQMLTAEAATIGIVGTALGAALGTLLADRLVGGVAATIDDFALRSAVTIVTPSVWLYGQGAILGLLATLVAAAWPVLDAARLDPSSAMQRTTQERTTTQRVRRGPRISLLLVVAGFAILTLPTRSLEVAFAGLACIIAAGATIAPTAIVVLARWLEPILERVAGLAGRMAARNVQAQQSRIAVAAAALTIAVAAVIGIGVMIGSFRLSLSRWLDVTLTSDVFVSADESLAAATSRLAALDQIAAISEARIIEVPTEYGIIGVRAFAPATRGWGLNIVDGDPETAIAALAAGTHIVVSEPFAYRNELSRGDSLLLSNPSGMLRLPISGIYRDYNTGGTSAVMALGVYRQQWRDSTINTIGLELNGPIDEPTLRAAIGGASQPPNLRITSTAAVKSVSLSIFDRTFAITGVLRTLAGLVAFFGMLSALIAIQLERQHELAVLRALGFAPSGIGMLILTETGLTGIAAGLTAIPLGLLLAELLVRVINVRSFGWTMDFTVEPSQLMGGLGLAVAASVLAGLVPTLKSGARARATPA